MGHRIIEINSQSVVATPHEKIVHILSNAVGEVRERPMEAGGAEGGHVTHPATRGEMSPDVKLGSKPPWRLREPQTCTPASAAPGSLLFHS